MQSQDPHFRSAISLDARERRELVGWGSDIFDSEQLGLIWRPKQRQLLLYDGGRPVSKCGLLRQRVLVGEQALEMGGIGGVVTPPRLRGRGYARQVLAEALRIFAEEWRLHAAMLFCRPALVPFYRAQGWQQLTGEVQILQPEGMRASPVPVMVYPLGSPWPAGPVSIDSLPW